MPLHNQLLRRRTSSATKYWFTWIIETVVVPVIVGLQAVSAFEVFLQSNQRTLSSNPSKGINVAAISLLSVNEVNDYYTCILYVGTPPKPSPYLLILSMLTDASCGEACRNNKGFNHTESTSFKDTNRGGYYGRFVSDAITWNASEPLIAEHYFLLANFTLLADGLLVSITQGLGFSENSERIYTFLDRLKMYGVIKEKVFAL